MLSLLLFVWWSPFFLPKPTWRHKPVTGVCDRPTVGVEELIHPAGRSRPPRLPPADRDRTVLPQIRSWLLRPRRCTLASCRNGSVSERQSGTTFRILVERCISVTPLFPPSGCTQRICARTKSWHGGAMDLPWRQQTIRIAGWRISTPAGRGSWICTRGQPDAGRGRPVMCRLSGLRRVSGLRRAALTTRSPALLPARQDYVPSSNRRTPRVTTTRTDPVLATR